MSRFARITEDPEYDTELQQDEAYWEDKFSEWEANEGAVVKKPQEEYSPYETVNS